VAEYSRISAPNRPSVNEVQFGFLMMGPGSRVIGYYLILFDLVGRDLRRRPNVEEEIDLPVTCIYEKRVASSLEVEIGGKI
jgi:hypothetical protein